MKNAISEKNTSVGGVFTSKQVEYIREANRRWNFKIGATRSGKSFVDIRHVIPNSIRKRIEYPGLVCILGVTEGTIERNLLLPMRNIFGEKLVSSINNRNSCQLFGETVFCLGAEKVNQVAKLRGASFKYVYGDEVAEWNRDVFEILKSRLDKPYSRFDGTCNPEGPSHWLKRFIDKDVLNIYTQYYSIDDNPYLDDTFVEELKQEYSGSVYYNRYILGEWAAADGLVFSMFSREKYTVNHVPPINRYYVSIDYGTQNPTAMLLFGQHNGIWYCVDEFYHSGRDSGRLMTDEDYYNELCKLTERNRANPERVIIDPSAASFIALIRSRGRFPVKRADNDVLNGIRNTCSAFNSNILKIHVCCRNLINEILQYSWDTRSETEKPLKINDHACDALRYFIRTIVIRR